MLCDGKLGWSCFLGGLKAGNPQHEQARVLAHCYLVCLVPSKVQSSSSYVTSPTRWDHCCFLCLAEGRDNQGLEEKDGVNHADSVDTPRLTSLALYLVSKYYLFAVASRALQ